MLSNRNWFSRALVLVICVSLGAMVWGKAFGQEASGDPGASKKYVLRASTWGAAQDQAVAKAGGTVEYSHGASGLAVATSDQAGFLTMIKKSGINGAEDVTVTWQDPNERVGEDALTPDAVNPANDNFINLQWNVIAVEAAGAWNAGFDGSGVRVAVIDGGMCSLHPDVAPNLDVAHSRSFVPGFNYDQDTGGPSSFRHACHVAGIIAAVDNTIGTIGVAPHATIISCKALHGGSGTFGAVIAAILYASDPIAAGGGGADIINMSLGALFPRGGGNTGAGQLVAALNQAVNYATAHNVLCVSAAGNAALDLDHSGSFIQIPAQSGSGIAVSATGPIGYAVGWPNGATNFRTPASYTNFGRSAIWVAAPGGNDQLPGNALCSIPRVVGPPVTTACWVFDLVLSPGSQSGSYFFAEGTSMATPHAAAVAAIIKQRFPGISVGDLKTALKNTADDEGPVGTDPYFGHGFVNARRAATDPPSLLFRDENSLGASSTAASVHVDAPELSIIPNREHTHNTITFALPASGQAKLELFDLAGRRVATLFDGMAQAGVTTLHWDGNGASGRVGPGAYFARLSTAGVYASRKLILLNQ